MAMTDADRQQFKNERAKYEGILERYAKRKLEDDQKVHSGTNGFPQDSVLTEDEQSIHKVAFERKVDEIRNSMYDSKVQAYGEKVIREEQQMKIQEKVEELQVPNNTIRGQIQQLTKIVENELLEKGLIHFDQNIQLAVIRAACPNCGTELTTDVPKMFNPFTGESLSKHVCKNCQSAYNLEYAYPRLAIFGADGKEIKAFGN